jgi:DNA replication protein DnaC
MASKKQTAQRVITSRFGTFELKMNQSNPPEHKPAPSLLVLDSETKRKHYAQAVEKLNLGQRYTACYFVAEGEILTDAQVQAKKWAEQIKQGDTSKPFLLMTGTCGTGKTWSGISALLALGVQFQGWGTVESPEWTSHVTAKFYTHYQLADAVMRTDDGNRQRSAMLSTPVLMLDDLRTDGTGRVSEALLAWLDELINHRYNHCLPTIITANTTGEQFKATYGQKIEDRLIHAGVILKINRSSLRKELAAHA